MFEKNKHDDEAAGSQKLFTHTSEVVLKDVITLPPAGRMWQYRYWANCCG